MDNGAVLMLLTMVLIISSIFSMVSKNSMFAVFFLLICFLVAFAFLLTLNCEFLAFVILLVYVGAITILFLFAMMLLDIKFNSLSYFLSFYFFGGCLLFVIVMFCLNFMKMTKTFMISPDSTLIFINWKYLINSVSKMQTYSVLLYTNFFIQFLMTGLVLLLVLIGVVFLVNVYINLNFKTQHSFKQNALNLNFFS